MRRVLAFPLVRLAMIAVAFGVLVTPVVLAARAPHSAWRDVALNWILAALLLAAIVAVERFTVGKSFAEIGLAPRGAFRNLALGAGLGAALFSMVVLELALGGYYRIVAIHVTRDLAIAALLLLPGAAAEELLFRGVIFRLVEEWAGTWIALAVSAVIFGFAHAANPGATWISTIAIALEAGVLLGAAFVVTRNLWFPIGLHFAWNFSKARSLERKFLGTPSSPTRSARAFGVQRSSRAALSGLKPAFSRSSRASLLQSRFSLMLRDDR